MFRRSAPVFALVLSLGLLSYWHQETPPEPQVETQTQTKTQIPTLPARTEQAEPPVTLQPDASSEPERFDAGPPPTPPEDASAPTPIPLGEPDSGPLAALTTAEPAEPLPTFTMDASVRTPNDPRFTIRWGQAGLCGEEPLEQMAQRRAALLSTFIGVRRAGTLIFRDPEAPPAFVDQAGDSLAQARIIVARLLGPGADVALPVIYVYASGEQMRDVACVNAATAGYYDGAIHLPATDPDAHRTVIHEHVHHVLNALGLRKPMWLHEGLAMYAADERWWEDPRLGLTAWLRAKHLPFPALVEAFPHTSDELFAGAAYYQSYQMVSFLGARSGRADFAWLVEGLVSGRLSAQTAFGESVGLSGEHLESAWRGFIQSR